MQKLKITNKTKSKKKLNSTKQIQIIYKIRKVIIKLDLLKYKNKVSKCN